MSKKKALADYIEVKDRIAQFRDECPGYSIDTEIIERGDDYCLIKATICDGVNLLATGHSLERLSDNVMVNRTSLVENCETSAVGRALAFLGYKITGAIASREEMLRTQQTYTGSEDDKKLLNKMLRREGITDPETAKAIHESAISSKVFADEISIIKLIEEFSK